VFALLRATQEGVTKVKYFQPKLKTFSLGNIFIIVEIFSSLGKYFRHCGNIFIIVENIFITGEIFLSLWKYFHHCGNIFNQS